MRCLTHTLLRRLSCLSTQCAPGRWSQIFSPKWSSLRQSYSARPGVVTATSVVNYWQKVFETNGIPEARESSEYIVSFVLGAKTFQSLSSKSLCAPLTAAQQEQIQQLSSKRLERMPVQYVLGEWDFRDLTLKMRPPVFIPRPETEDLVSLVVEEECLMYQKNSGLCFQPSAPHPVILEIGCGSGAIALSLLHKLPQSWVIAMDKEEAAVDLTRENAHRLQLQERIHVLHQDISFSSAKQLLLWGPIDFIVSNPPYVFHEDIASLDTEILRYEDLDALDGGDDGMRVIKTILSLAPSLLKDSGSVFLEVDPRHPDMVKDWLQAHSDLLLVLRAVHKDFCGNFNDMNGAEVMHKSEFLPRLLLLESIDIGDCAAHLKLHQTQLARREQDRIWKEGQKLFGFLREVSHYCKHSHITASSAQKGTYQSTETNCLSPR